MNGTHNGTNGAGHNGAGHNGARSQRSPVIIVGGGPVGLSCSILLSLRNIPHLLFERHALTSIHPKAAGINQRTTEIFRVMGVEDEVYSKAAPSTIAGRTAWYTSLGPSGREIFSRDAWGGGQYREEYESFSPSKYCILPQIRLEPILKRRAIELNPSGLFFNHEVVKVANIDTGAYIEVRDRDSGDVRTESASYIVVADGGRMFTEQLGISWNGEAALFDMVTAHIRAPLRHLHPDPSNFMTWFSSPEMGGSTRTGYLYQIGPWPDCLDNPALEEWVFACGKLPSDPATFDQASMIQRFRRTIGIPDIDVEVMSFSHWTVNAIHASKFRIGNIFLAGDSSHRIPPWGALGMNTGVQDVQNLVWKLALALEDPERYDSLLDTYETERLDVGRRVGLTSLENMRSHSAHIDKALGISATATPEENIKAAAAYFDPTHLDHAQKRAAIKKASNQMDSEFKAPGYEVGWFYPSVDIDREGGESHGGQSNPDGSLVYHTYFPSTIPGHHLPHVWLRNDQGGGQVAIRDLLDLNRLTLFKDGLSTGGLEADKRTTIVTIGKGGWGDTTGSWQKLRGVAEDGGVLVRPDGIVAWRGTLDGIDQHQWALIVDRVLAV